jgi:hypothetical protein
VAVPVLFGKESTGKKMKNRNRDLLVLLRTASLTADAFEKHIECLHHVVVQVEQPDVFCQAHELVMRNSITTKKKRILRAVEHETLKPFYFLINKN